MKTQELIKAQENLARAAGGLNKSLGLKAAEPAPEPTPETKPEEEEKTDPADETVEDKVEALKKRCEALEKRCEDLEKMVNEKQEETAKACAAATAAMKAATATITEATQRLADPAWAQAHAIGAPAATKALAEAAETKPAGEMSVIDAFLALKPGSAEAAAFYKANAEAISAAINHRR